MAVPVQVPLLPEGLLRDPEGDPVPEELLALCVGLLGGGKVGCKRRVVVIYTRIHPSIHPPTKPPQTPTNHYLHPPARGSGI